MYRKPRGENDPLWTPTPPQAARFEPSQSDRAWAAEASARGSFLPARLVPGCTRPTFSKTRGRWNKAIANFQAAKPGKPLPGIKK